MGKQELIDRLKHGGVEAWNQWRKENPDIKIDFSGFIFWDFTLSGADLSDADLSGVCFSLFNPYRGSGNFADFYRSDPAYTDLSHANLSGANLRSADLKGADLSHANLSGADLSGADLSSTDLNRANLRGADLLGTKLNFASLAGANLCNADLRDAELVGADLSRSNLMQARLMGAKLHGVDFSGAELIGANLNSADLSSVNFCGVNLSEVNLFSSNLNRANLRGANLSSANLTASQALGTCFKAATLTGACVQDWNINSRTNLQEVICKYIFTRFDYKQEQFTDRRPHDPDQPFSPGEFTKRYQIVLESVELFFADGIDWRAFLASLKDAKAQYGDELNIQGIEKKAGGSFMVRLELPSDVDKGLVERRVKELYENKLQSLEAYYQERLQLQGEQLSFFQQQVEIERVGNTRLERIIETMAEKQSSKYDLRGAKFGGGFAAEGGIQIDGTLNDFSKTIEQNKADIENLIQSLRGLVETFPTEKREEANVHLDDLEDDLQHPEKRKPNRIKTRLTALLMIAVQIGSGVATATDFTNNVLELSKKLEIPIEQVEPQSQQKNAIDVKAIGSD